MLISFEVILREFNVSGDGVNKVPVVRLVELDEVILINETITPLTGCVELGFVNELILNPIDDLFGKTAKLRVIEELVEFPIQLLIVIPDDAVQVPKVP